MSWPTGGAIRIREPAGAYQSAFTLLAMPAQPRGPRAYTIYRISIIRTDTPFLGFAPDCVKRSLACVSCTDLWTEINLERNNKQKIST